MLIKVHIMKLARFSRIGNVQLLSLLALAQVVDGNLKFELSNEQ
jgi:hypothetical protein